MSFRNLAIAGLIAMFVAGGIGCGADSGDGAKGRSGTGGSGKGSGGGLSELEGEVVIDGSSTVYPISEAVAEAFEKDFKKVKVSVAISGTGGGFKRFTKGETDISDASRPIKSSEFDECKAHKVAFVEIPVAYDGLSIVVNPENDFVEQLTVDDLKKIFLEEGGAKTWKDVNEEWPELAIKIYAPGTDSGTFDYFFGDVVNKNNRNKPRSDMSVSEDDNQLVTGVAGEKGAIGFFGAAYYFNNKDKVKVAKIINSDGEAIGPTPESIKDGTYNPFSRPLFIYLKVDSLKRPEIKKFVEFYLNNAKEMASKVGYVGLPDEVYELATKHYEDRLIGTHFLTAEGEKRIGSLTDIYKSDNLVGIE